MRTVKPPDVRRLEIIRAARRLFLYRDFEQTTMQNVVDELGLAKGTVYYYFPSKDALLEAVVQDLIDEVFSQMSDLLDAADGTALEKMRLLVSAGNMAGENAALLDHIHQPSSSGLHTRLLAAALQKQAPLYARIIEQGCREGVFHTETPLEAAEFMLAGIQFLTDLGIHPWSEEDLVRRSRAFPHLLEHLLGAPEGSSKSIFPSSE